MIRPIEQRRYVTDWRDALRIFGVVFGKRFGSNPQLANSGLIASYIASVATLAAWIAVIDHLA
jgi:hypothetical protein